MFKNLQIKLLRYQKTYLQGKLLLNKAGLVLSNNNKIQAIGLFIVLSLSLTAILYRPVSALENPNKGTEETSNLNFKLADTNNLVQTGLVMAVGGYIKSEESDTGDKKVSWQPVDDKGGAMGIVAGATATMYKEGPVGTQQYLAYLGQKAKIGPAPIYAQSIQGFDILSPILKLWEWSRNLVYIFYVIIFIVIGVMIIMRHRLGGQVQITVINSIPNIIISLILVTFSFAISGLIIDAMHLATGVIHSGFFGTNGIAEEPPGSDYSFQSPEMSTFKIFGTADITNFDTAFEMGDIEGVMGQKVINFVVDIIEGVANFNTLVSAVLSIAAVTAMFKIFFTLLTKYLGFMLSPVIAPFQFLLGSIPGKSESISGWFKGMFSSVAAFVGVYTAFCVMIVLTDTSVIAPDSWNWFPPLTGFSASTETIAHLLAYALFISTPNIPALLEKAFEAQPTGMFGGVGGETQSAISKVSMGLLGGR